MKLWAKLNFILLAGLLITAGLPAVAQVDQGSISGTVLDTSGAVIPGADVKLTSTDTGLVLDAKTDASGVYVFSPIKIGNYRVSASAPNFETTTQQNVHLDLQERLNVPLTLKPGNTTETVTVSTAPPLLQASQGSVGQVISTTAINNTPLNGRNWVYIAQLTAGVDPGSGSRGQGKGDFDANGQRTEENNFILDGVDNNSNAVDFLNGASFVVRPPPDALAEFKISTGDYSAEFGHSAGAVMNASIKSGTNQIHGDLWEYLRNDAFDARDWDAPSIPKYRENQFGATLGFPILRNKLFFFGDAEANRIVFGETNSSGTVGGTAANFTVPTPLMRQGNFSELLNPALTGSAQPIQLFEPNTGGAVPLTCNGQANVLCPDQIDSVAQNILNLYPSPNTNSGKTFSNYNVVRNSLDNTAQWDARLDWNISGRDQAFVRMSYLNEPGYRPPPLGPILDGGTFADDGTIINFGQNYALSETHIFNPNLVNEFRFGYNYGHFAYFQVTSNEDISSQLGFGGIPFDAALRTGGLPYTSPSGISSFGAPEFLPSNEHENVYQILDNLTKIIGNHSLKFGLDLQSIRFNVLQPTEPRGAYTYTGLYTGNLGASFTGSGVADFLANQMNSAAISTEQQIDDFRWYRAAYVQDDWKVNANLTLNLGLRYDYVQPVTEVSGQMANFLSTGPFGSGTGSGTYNIPASQRNAALSPVFTTILAENNIALQYSNSRSLINAQKTNFAPRFGFADRLDPKTVIRGGYGIFFGGLENRGGTTNLGDNYPFELTDNFPAPTCKKGLGNCASNGITLETGFTQALQQGLINFIATPALQGYQLRPPTPYAMDYNLVVERSLSNNLVASVGYVGTASRHLQVNVYPNGAAVLLNPSASIQGVRPFPKFGASNLIEASAESSYNSLQARIEKRYANGLNFLATYTWAHSLDDAPTSLSSDTSFSNTLLVPITYDYSNSVFDVRQRVTFNGYYQLPFGKGRAHLSHNNAVDLLAGGWDSSLTFVAQTGEPFTVTPNTTAPAGISSRAILVGNPFKAGGSPNPTNPTIACAARTRSKTNWYNPCAFANPEPGTNIPASGPGSQVSSLSQVLAFYGGKRNLVAGPGLTRVNMSLFKDVPVFRATYLEFRADVFNLLNTPSYATPSVLTDNSSGGLITGAQTPQLYTPDARFFQLSLKYIF